MGRKPKKEPDLDKIRRQTAERVRRHRARHRDELTVGAVGRPTWLVADLLDDSGAVVDVVVYQQPAGALEGRISHAWTPTTPMAFETALRLRAYRSRQVASWRAGVP